MQSILTSSLVIELWMEFLGLHSIPCSLSANKSWPHILLVYIFKHLFQCFLFYYFFPVVQCIFTFLGPIYDWKDTLASAPYIYSLICFLIDSYELLVFKSDLLKISFSQLKRVVLTSVIEVEILWRLLIYCEIFFFLFA